MALGTEELTVAFRQLFSKGRAPGTYLLGSWASLRAGLKAVAKRKNSPTRESNPDSTVLQPSLIQLVGLL
jgi:hypothetical protein